MRRSLPTAVAALALVLAAGCSDDAAGPRTPMAGQLAVVPNFGTLQGGLVEVARGRFVLTRIPGGAVARDTVIDIPIGADSVDLSLTVPVLVTGETFDLTIALISPAGDTVFRGGPIVVAPGTSGTPVAVDVPFSYVGPGAAAAGVRIVSPDTSTLTGVPVLLTAEAFDSAEVALPGAPIGWTSLDTGRVQVTTDALYRGLAVGGTERGVARLVATLVTGQTDTVFVSNQPLPTAIVADSGNAQSTLADSTLPQALVARVTAADGLGVSGLWVRFAISSGGGSLSADSVLTDATGRAGVAYTLARTFQTPTVTATTALLGTQAATFTATLLFAPTAALEVVTGDAQTAIAGSPVDIAPQVRAVGADGLPVPGVTVTFAVIGGGGIVAGGTPVTDTLGLAAVTSWTLGVTAGPNTLQASVNGITAEFTATGIAGSGQAYWNNPAGGNWSDPANWLAGVVPGTTDTVQLTLGLDYLVSLDVSATVAKLTIGGTADVISLAVGDQTLTITDAGTDPGLDILPLGSIEVGNGGIVAERISNQGSVRFTGTSATLATGTVTNANAWRVVGGQLTVTGEAFDFQTSGLLRLEAGAALIVAGNGFLTYLGGTIEGGLGTGNGLAFLSGAELGLQADLAYDSLTITLDNGRIQGLQTTERLTIGPDAGLSLSGATLAEVQARVITQGGIVATGGPSNFLNDSLYVADGGFVIVEGTVAATRLTANGIDNSGTITLVGTNQTTLQVTGAGGLTIRPTGVVATLPGGTRILDATLINEGGTLTTDGTTQITRASAQHVNGAGSAIELVGGSLTFTQSGTSPSFLNGSVILLGPGTSLVVSGGTFGNDAGGSIMGSGTVDVTGTAFTNSGALAPGLSPGALTWLGNLPMTPTARLEIELGGTTVGTGYDQLNASGSLVTLNGTLDVQLLSPFVPAPGDQFTVLTFGDRSRSDFLTVTLPDLSGQGLTWTRTFGTTDMVLSVVPVLAPILFAGDSAGGSSGIFSVLPDGTGQFNVTTEGPPAELMVHPRWSPDRTRITYTARQPGDANQLHIRSADGQAVFHLTSATDTSTFRPRYSPDGVHLAFACGDGGYPNTAQDVCVIADVTNPFDNMGNGSTGKAYVTDTVDVNLGGSGAFAWNPDKPDQLAVVRDSVIPGPTLIVGSLIWLVNYDGSGKTSLGTAVIKDELGSPVQVYSMDWSPDGSFIAFEGVSPLGRSIFLIEVATGIVTQLTNNGQGFVEDFGPVVSPDGNTIIFGRTSDGWQLWTMDAAGVTETAMTGLLNFNPDQGGWDWSPDGSEIVLTEDLTTSSVLISKILPTTTESSFGKDVKPVGRRALSFEVQDRQPSWRP